MHAGIQKMNEYPRLEDIFRQIKCSKEFQDTVDEILTVENRKMPDEEKFCFFGTGRTNDLPSEAILFIISQSKEYPRLDCMAQDYVILGFSADKWNVYKAELEHDFSADKDKLEICSNYVTDGNEHHGIGSAGVQKIISLARMLKCKEIWGKAESYLDETEEGKERLRNFYKKKVLSLRKIMIISV